KFTAARPSRPCLAAKKLSEPTGFARLQEKGDRRSLDNDSGKTNSPYIALVKERPAEIQKGSRGLICPRNPPIAGPSTQPTPQAAPNSPKLAARISGGVTAAMYAYAVGMLEAVIPETIRPAKSHCHVGASAITT